MHKQLIIVLQVKGETSVEHNKSSQTNANEKHEIFIKFSDDDWRFLFELTLSFMT